MFAHRYMFSAGFALAVASFSAFAEGEDDIAVVEDSKMEWVSVKGAYFGKQVSDSVKTPTLLVNVPQSVTVWGAEDISDRALFSIADVMQYTPGVSIGLGEDHRDQITIRGQNTTADFFIDGLRDDVQYFRPLYNIERVEILKGANALLFGRGGGGGVVNRVTKTADIDENFSSITAGVDTFSAGSLSVDSNVVLGDGHALRLNGVVDTIDNHRDSKDGDRYAINPTYTWEASQDSRLTASYEYVDDDRIVDRGVPAGENNRPLEGTYDTYFGDPDFNQTTFEGHIFHARLEHRFADNWTANGTIQYADYDKFYQNLYPVGFDASEDQVTLDGYQDLTDRENTLLQVNIVGEIDTGPVAHTILAGVEYGQQDTANARRDARFVESDDDQISFAFSNPLVVPEFGLTEAVRDRESEVVFTSVFFQDEIQLTDNWIVVAGLRYDSFDIDVANRDSGNPVAIESSDTEVSPRAGLIYKPSEDVSLYASYSKSFLPRSGDQFLTLSTTAAALDPEEFENQEIGLKWNLTNELALNVAYFEVERESGTAVDPTNAERSILVGTETQGLEVELVGQLTEAWVINAGYSNLDAQQVGNVEGGEIQNADLAQVPEHMFTLWNKVAISDNLQLAGGVIYQSEQYASLSNGTELPDYTRFDAALYYQPTSALSLQLNIENIFDEEYFPSAHNDNNIATGKPLNARIGMTYTF